MHELVVAALLLAVSFGDALKVATVSAPLTAEETALAAGLAEQALRSEGLWTTTRMHLVEAVPHRDAAAENNGTFERMARLTYYRYDGALTISVVVNLARRQATVRRLPNFEAPFSAEEYALARRLVFADPRVREALAAVRDRVIIEPITSRHDSPGDPLFRHRVIYFFFRVGSRYLLRDRLILVDLTTQIVILQPIAGSPAHPAMGGR